MMGLLLQEQLALEPSNLRGLDTLASFSKCYQREITIRNRLLFCINFLERGSNLKGRKFSSIPFVSVSIPIKIKSARG